MRVSTMMIFDNLMRNVARAVENTQKIQEVIISGKKISRLSDDPIGAAQVINFQSELIRLSQYKKNISHGNSWLNMSDSVLQDMQSLLGEVKNIAIAQSTSTVSEENRAQAAGMVQNFYNQLINYANTKLGDSYIFGGSITDIAPFNTDGTYKGNGDDITVGIVEGIKTKINLAGSEFLITDLNPALSTVAATAGSTSSTGLTAKNINAILANPGGLSEYKVTFVLTNGLTQEITYTTDSSPTRDELGTGIADAVNNNDVLNQYIRASYTTTGNITFEAKEVGTEGNAYTIDAANTTALGGTVVTSFAGGESKVTSGFIFNGTNSDIVFEEKIGGGDITTNIITNGGAVSEQIYTGEQVASFIGRAMESKSNNSYTYTVSYNESTNFFTITNDDGNGDTIELKWNDVAATADGTLGFNNTDSGDIVKGAFDVSDNEVEFNVIDDVNDKFRLTIDDTPSAADIVITAGSYTTATLAAQIQNRIINDASFAGITVDFGTTISGQFSIISSTTGTSSTVTLTSDTTDDFLRTVGLDHDFEVSGTSPTPLADLNNGAGVTAGNITITDREGINAVIAVNAADTIFDVIDDINGAAAISVTAQLNTEGNGIDIIDNNSFPIQNLVVADNDTARDLGIAGNKPGNIYGSDLNPAVSDATRISTLKEGAGLTLSSIRVVNGLKNEKIDLSRAVSITDVLTAINSLNIDVAATINSSKTALDVNSSSADSAAVVCEVDEGTTSSDLGIQGATDFFKSIAVLKEALEKNDRFALLNMLDQFDLILNKLVEKRSGVGGRTNQLDAMNNRIVTSELEISAIKSDIEDADMIEYLSKFTLQQTALEAIMATAARSIQMSLLNFLR